MKKITIKIIAAMVVIIGLYGIYATWSLEHVKHITVISPSKKLTAAVILLGEGGDPPYGESIVIYQTSSFFGTLTGEELYSGYCEGKTGLLWKSDNELEVSCGDYKKFKIQKREAKGVRISYAIDPNAIALPSAVKTKEDTPDLKPTRSTPAPLRR